MRAAYSIRGQRYGTRAAKVHAQCSLEYPAKSSGIDLEICEVAVVSFLMIVAFKRRAESLIDELLQRLPITKRSRL